MTKALQTFFQCLAVTCQTLRNFTSEFSNVFEGFLNFLFAFSFLSDRFETKFQVLNSSSFL